MEKVEMQQKIKCKARNEVGTHAHTQWTKEGLDNNSKRSMSRE